MALTVVGHSRTTCSASTPQVARNVAGTYDYGYIATGPESDLTPDTLLFRRNVATNAIDTFNPATITGNPFKLPLGGDNHFTLAVMPDVDENIHVIGNTHAQPIQYGYTQWPPTPTSWTFPSYASLPMSATGAQDAGHTYSQWVRTTDGTIYCCMEQEENNSYEKRLWTWQKLAPHSLTWQFVDPANPVLITGNHPALSTEPDRCYASITLVGNRIHYIGMWARVDEGTSLWWRRGAHYMFTDPPYTTWQTITGTVMTLPLTFANYSAAAITSAPAYHMTWSQGWAVDASGYPHMHWENTQADGNPNPAAPYVECWWNGTAWTSRNVFGPGSGNGPGIFFSRGMLWTSTSASQRMRIGDPVTHISTSLGGAAPNGICAVPEPIGVRDGNRISFVVADGDNPLVFEFAPQTSLRFPG